jgi:hypothetical protein
MISASLYGVSLLIIELKRGPKTPNSCFIDNSDCKYQPIAGAVRATGVAEAAARSRGKL